MEERKKEYNASGRGNKPRTDEEEDERMQRLMLEPTPKKPSKDVAGVYLPSAYGVDIEAEQMFQQELHGIVDDMKVKLVDEKKILEGTLNPEYGKGEWEMPYIEKIEGGNVEENTWLFDGSPVQDLGKNGWRLCLLENELSQPNPTEEQWKSISQSGSLIIDLTPTSTHDSNSSSFIAEDFNPSFHIVSLGRQSITSPISSCSGKSGDCGIETDVMNECSECTVPMISAAMLGTPSEVRWLPPLRSMESSVLNLLDARS